MNYALNFPSETAGDAFEDEFADYFWELEDEFPVHECESCARSASEIDGAEWEAEFRRGRRLPSRPSRVGRPVAYRKPARPRKPKYPQKLRTRPVGVFAGSNACTCPAPNCPEHGSEYVRWVQSSLNRIMNLRLAVTGIMNPATRSALRSFQEKQGLPVDGIAGPETKEALIREKGGKSFGADVMKSDEPGMTNSPVPAPAITEAEFETEDEELSGDENAQASANAARRAARESYDKFRRDCKGVRLLRRLTKEPSDPISKSARLRKKVEQVPELFRKIRLENEKLNASLKSARSAAQRELLRKQHRSTIAKLLDQAGFDPRVNWTEESALAHARCELSEFNWIQYSLCSGKEVETPDRFAKAVAEHYLRTESGVSLNGQTAKCQIHSVFCDVSFPNGIVIRVNFSNIPDFFTAVQVAPRTGPKREYRYSCFRGQINLGPNQDALPAGDWPHKRSFSPSAPSVPSGPYQVSTPTCVDFQMDLTEFRSLNEAFRKSVAQLDMLVKQKPRNEPLFKETTERAKKQQTALKIILEKMINRTRSGWYLRKGCSHKDIAKATCKIRNLPGVWQRKPPIQPIKKLRDQLVFLLRHSRGEFNNVACNRL